MIEQTVPPWQPATLLGPIAILLDATVHPGMFAQKSAKRVGGAFNESSGRRVSDSPLTRATLLLRLRDGSDHDAWKEFLELYGPMLYRFVRRRGLQDADAADVVQDVFRRVGTAIGRLDYDREKGGFRAWLFTITRNRLYTFFQSRQRLEPSGHDTAQLELLSQAVDERNELVDQWELEHLRSLAGIAMQTVEQKSDPKTWSAFRMTAIEGRSAAEAAAELSMTPGAIYVAKSRVTARLRAEIERLEQQADGGE